MANYQNCPECGLLLDLDKENRNHFPYKDCSVLKSKRKAGRPKGSKTGHEIKVSRSIRIYPSNLEIIKRDYGGLQNWINEMAKNLGGNQNG